MRHLGYVNICGSQFEVVESTPKKHRKLRGAYGYIDLAEERIVIEKGRGAQHFTHILLHEGLHGIFALAGFQYLISEKVDDWEELGIRMMVPSVLNFLAS